MRIAVISDIHGNAEALTAVLSHVEEIGVDFTVCLGDIVGYYPDPEFCVETIRDMAIYTVAGNHDRAVTGGISMERFNEHAEAALLWTESRLSSESKLFLASLPLTIRLEGMLFTHASPHDPAGFPYLFPADRLALSQAFSDMVCPLCFVGHTHWPFIMARGDMGIENTPLDGPVLMKSDTYYLVNAGSVGQPRDHDPRASWALCDTVSRQLQVHRVAYDWRVTQRKVTASGLPTFLAHRLSKGN